MYFLKVCFENVFFITWGRNFEKYNFWESNIENVFFEGAILKCIFEGEIFLKKRLKCTFWMRTFLKKIFYNVFFKRGILKINFSRKEFESVFFEVRIFENILINT